MGIGILLVWLLASWTLLRNALIESRCLLVVFCPVLAFSSLTLVTNFTARFFSITVASTISVLPALAYLLVSLRPEKRRNYPPWEPVPTWAKIIAIAFSVLVYVYTVTVMYTYPEKDLWIDLPLQGLFYHGVFPARNPFFPDLEMHGHYGRNLLVALLGTHLGCSPLDIHLVATPITQALLSLSLSLSLGKLANSYRAAILATIVSFLGMAVGGWVGLLDHYFHYTGTAYLIFVCTFHCCAQLSVAPSRKKLVLSALMLSALAFFYEILFVLIIPMVVIFWLHHNREMRSLKSLLSSIGLAFTMTLLQGGALSDITTRFASGENIGAMSRALQNQSQRVQIQLPKERFGQIYMHNWDFWRISCGQKLLRKVLRNVNRRNQRRWVSFLSWNYLQLFWIPTLLSPLMAWLSYKRPNPLRSSWLALGLISYLIPFFVGFGPLYDDEYYRWAFCSSFAFSVALGLSLDELLHIGSKKLTVPFISFLILVTVAPGLVKLRATVAQKTLRLRPSSSLSWIERNARALNADQALVKSAFWLSENASSGENVLTNDVYLEPFQIMRESTLVHLSGLFCVGHEMPRPRDPIGFPPYRHNALARSFWSSGEELALQHLRVNWLIARHRKEGLDQHRLSSIKGLRYEESFSAESGQKLDVYSYSPRISTSEVLLGHFSLVGYELLVLNPGATTTIKLELENVGESLLKKGTPVWATFSDTSSFLPEKCSVTTLGKDLASGHRTVLSLSLAAPFGTGSHRLELLAGTPPQKLDQSISFEVGLGPLEGVEYQPTSEHLNPRWVLIEKH